MDTLAGPLRRKSTMSIRSLYRRHSPQFKLPLCADIRHGKIGRREAMRTYPISANRIQLWLSQYDRGELNAEEAAAITISEYEAKIAALERTVGQLMMEVGLLNPPDCDSKPAAKTALSSAPLGLSIRRGQMIQLPRSTFYDQAQQ